MTLEEAEESGIVSEAGMEGMYDMLVAKGLTASQAVDVCQKLYDEIYLTTQRVVNEAL